MPRYGEKLNEAVQNLRIKLYVMSFDSVQQCGLNNFYVAAKLFSTAI